MNSPIDYCQREEMCLVVTRHNIADYLRRTVSGSFLHHSVLSSLIPPQGFVKHLLVVRVRKLKIFHVIFQIVSSLYINATCENMYRDQNQKLV